MGEAGSDGGEALLQRGKMEPSEPPHRVWGVLGPALAGSPPRWDGRAAASGQGFAW